MQINMQDIKNLILLNGNHEAGLVRGQHFKDPKNLSPRETIFEN